VFIGGRDVTSSSVACHRAAGLAYIPEDRIRRGTASNATVWENLVMGRHRSRELAWHGTIARRGPSATRAREQMARFDIRAATPYVKSGTLSGGNMQKIVLARELCEPTRVIVAEQPTRGLDIGAADFVLNELLRARDEGSAVLLVSYELPELLDIADRLLVMFAGRVIGELRREEFSEGLAGLLMAGVPLDEARAVLANEEVR
jgi:general nucleoside transport system ATP-binding protein